jgi:hypothetical protein
MVRTTVQEWVTKYSEGVRANANRYVENAIRYGVPKLQQYASAFLAAHQAAPYLAVLQTDADRLRNVQLSWTTTRQVVAQYRGRGAAIAGAVPLVAPPVV